MTEGQIRMVVGGLIVLGIVWAAMMLTIAVGGWR